MHKPLYCSLQILDVRVLECAQKKYIFIDVDISSIEKSFPNAYLLITEENFGNDTKNINLTIVGRYACISPKIKAIPASTVVLSEDFFVAHKNIITTGKPETHLFTVNKIKDGNPSIYIEPLNVSTKTEILSGEANEGYRYGRHNSP